MIGRNGERGSGISVLAARHDDDDDELNDPTITNFLIQAILSKTKKLLSLLTNLNEIRNNIKMHSGIDRK